MTKDNRVEIELDLDEHEIYQLAMEEIKDAEQELQNRFELPPDMFVG